MHVGYAQDGVIVSLGACIHETSVQVHQCDVVYDEASSRLRASGRLKANNKCKLQWEEQTGAGEDNCSIMMLCAWLCTSCIIRKERQRQVLNAPMMASQTVYLTAEILICLLLKILFPSCVWCKSGAQIKIWIISSSWLGPAAMWDNRCMFETDQMRLDPIMHTSAALAGVLTMVLTRLV